MSSVAPSSTPVPATLPRRKTRLSIACEACRFKHFRCDGRKPVCSRCSISSKQCVYPASRRGNVKDRTAHNPAPISENTSDHGNTNHGEIFRNGDVTATSGPSSNQSFNLSPGNSAIEGIPETDLLDLYYEFFHSAHPCALPRRHLLPRLLDDQLYLLVKVMYYIGSLFAPPARSEGRQDPIESALHDFRCGVKVPNGFDVQAILLYSVAVYWRNEPSAGTALLEESIRMATTLGMNQKRFAARNSQGDAVLEESWRRTWWQIFIADAHIAGSAHSFSFRTTGVDMHVDLPCEEHEYEAGVIPPPKSLQEYDMREFFPSEEVQFSSYAELIGLTRGLYLALSCIDKPLPGQEASICANVDISMTAWFSLLPSAKQCALQADGSLDETMFKAQFIMHTCTVEFHRRLSSLRASPIECVSRCAPLAPSEQLSPCSHSGTTVHTVKCIQAIRKIDELLILPTRVTTHSPFLICMIANVTIANLSACRLILQGKDLAQHRERIRLTLGTLKSLGQYWPLGKRTYEEIGMIARDSFLSVGQSSSSTTTAVSSTQTCAVPIQPSDDYSLDTALNFDSFLDDALTLEYFGGVQEPIAMT